MRVAIGCGIVIVLFMLSGVIYALVGPKTQPPSDTADTASTQQSSGTGGAADTVELAEACSRGFVELHAKGRHSIDSFEVSLTSKSTKSLSVKILPGTVFTSTSPGTQSMIVVAERLISLAPKKSVDSYVVEAACINMHLSAPWSGDQLVLSGPAENQDLLKLVQLPEFQTKSFSFKQFAIWTITDNPRNADAYMGISSGFSPFGSGPSQTTLDLIRELFESAGIDTTRYDALKVVMPKTSN